MEMILIFCDDGDGDGDDDDDDDHDDDAYTGFDDYYGFPASEDDNAGFSSQWWW